MYLHKDDLKKMLEILEKFPEVDVVDVEVDSSSGIGSTTTMRFDTKIDGVAGKFEVEISGVETW
jgi:hypothetical protein